MKRLIVLSFLIVLFLGCNNPETVSPIIEKGESEVVTPVVFVLNEGNFGNGVATISKIESTDTSFSSSGNAYFSTNSEYLGNIAQSMIEIDNEYWIVVNNSQKIVRCDKNLTKIGEIKGFTSPRYVAFNENKIYVSDLYEDSIYVLNRNTYEIDKKIFTGGWNEEILVINEELWLTNTESNKVTVLSTDNENLIKEIQVVKQPLSIQADEKGNVWVLCNGGLISQEDDPYLFCINATDKQKTDSVNLSALDGLPSRLSVLENDVFFLSQDIYQYKNSNVSKIIDGVGLNIYSFHVSEDYIYYADAKDFVRLGDLYRYERNGEQKLETTTVGVIPGFIFEP